MPIYSRENHICDRCNISFDWVCFEIPKSRLSSGNFKVEVIPSEAKAHHFERINRDNYEVWVNCPHCGFENRFDAQALDI